VRKERRGTLLEEIHSTVVCSRVRTNQARGKAVRRDGIDAEVENLEAKIARLLAVTPGDSRSRHGDWACGTARLPGSTISMAGGR
jgi:hypothetical protein